MAEFIEIAFGVGGVGLAGVCGPTPTGSESTFSASGSTTESSSLTRHLTISLSGIPVNLDIFTNLPMGAVSVHLNIVDGATSIDSATALIRNPLFLINSFSRVISLLISSSSFFNYI